MRALVGLALGMVLLGACRTPPLGAVDLSVPIDAGDDGFVDLGPQLPDFAGIDAGTSGDPVDVLFVIDSEAGTAALRQRLRDASAALFDTLVPGSRDWHVGLITADLGSGSYGPAAGAGCTPLGDGAILNPTTNSCNANVPRYLASHDGMQNFEGDPGTFFDGCYVGDLPDGCIYQQPWDAVLHAFSVPENAGFLRAGGRLAIVLITDEEDCSLASGPSTFFDPLSSANGPAGPIRCFFAGATCMSGPTVSAGTYRSCQMKAATGPLLGATDLVAKLGALGKSRIDLWSLSGAGRTVTVKTQGGVLTESPLCSVGSGESSYPSVRVDQVPSGSGGTVVTSHSVCDPSFSATLAAMAGHLTAP